MKKAVLVFICLFLKIIDISSQSLLHSLPTTAENDETFLIRSNDEQVVFDAQSSAFGYDLFVMDIVSQEVSPLNIDPCKTNSARVVALEVFDSEADLTFPLKTKTAQYYSNQILCP